MSLKRSCQSKSGKFLSQAGKKGMSDMYSQLLESIYHLKAQTCPRLICTSEEPGKKANPRDQTVHQIQILPDLYRSLN